MKRFTLIASLFILIINNYTSAQTPFPGPSDVQKWEVVTWNFWGGYCERNLIKTGKEVALCTHDYIEVWDCDQEEQNCQLIGYYRLQGDSVMVRPVKIFRVNNQWVDSVDCSEPEGLMYDFAVPDTTELRCKLNYPGGSTTFRKISQNRVIYERTPRQTLNMQFAPYPSVPTILSSMQWIEGIGSNIHPFYSLSCIGDHCEQEQQVTRIFQNGNLIFVDTVLKFSFPCRGFVDLEDQSLMTTFDVYPNPATSKVVIAQSAENGPFQVRLFDAFGKMLYQTESLGHDAQIGLDHFTPGLYMVEIVQGNRREVVKVIRE
ncbi:MAG: T9SS type A sorting domain-containing protein [Bacteroidota bacterium]